MKNLLYVAFLLLSIGFSSCLGPPQACFEPDANLVDVGATVTFTNCSFSVNTYDWDFGDGGSATKRDVTHVYDSPGTYKVLLVASKDGGASSTAADNIVVGERKISLIRVNSFPSTNPLGDPWDTGNNPDLVFSIYETANQANILETSEKTDQSNAAPFLWDETAANFIFAETNYTWELRDEDGAIDDVIGTGNFDAYSVGGSDLVILLTGTGLEIELRYELVE